MVHVLDLLGCVVCGATTAEAIARTPEGICARLAVAAVTTSVAVRVTHGTRLGEGDPDTGFAPDFEPLTEAE